MPTVVYETAGRFFLRHSVFVGFMNTWLLKMTVGVLTTCHTQYT